MAAIKGEILPHLTGLEQEGLGQATPFLVRLLVVRGVRISGWVLNSETVFILHFSIHTLLMGYIEPVEFSRLGLLAITLVSISSPDEDLRKLGYESLGTFKKSLEVLNSCYLLNIDMIFCHTGLLNTNATGYCLLWQWQPQSF